MVSRGGRWRWRGFGGPDGARVRVVDAGVVWGRHDSVFTGSSYSIGESEWGSGSDNKSRCRGVLFQRV